MSLWFVGGYRRILALIVGWTNHEELVNSSPGTLRIACNENLTRASPIGFQCGGIMPFRGE